MTLTDFLNISNHTIDIFKSIKKDKLLVLDTNNGEYKTIELGKNDYLHEYVKLNTSSKTITLNTELIHYRYECIDYVIVHELSHFYHKDHSVRFWNEVSKHYPNYKAIRKELRY